MLLCKQQFLSEKVPRNDRKKAKCFRSLDVHRNQAERTSYEVRFSKD